MWNSRINKQFWGCCRWNGNIIGSGLSKSQTWTMFCNVAQFITDLALWSVFALPSGFLGIIWASRWAIRALIGILAWGTPILAIPIFEVTFRVLAVGWRSRTPIRVVGQRNQLLCGGFQTSELGIMAYEQIMKFLKREWFFPCSYKCRDFSKITA